MQLCRYVRFVIHFDRPNVNSIDGLDYRADTLDLVNPVGFAVKGPTYVHARARE